MRTSDQFRTGETVHVFLDTSPTAPIMAKLIALDSYGITLDRPVADNHPAAVIFYPWTRINMLARMGSPRSDRPNTRTVDILESAVTR